MEGHWKRGALHTCLIHTYLKVFDVWFDAWFSYDHCNFGVYLEEMLSIIQFL